MKKLSILALGVGMIVASSCTKTETAQPDGNTSDGMRVTQMDELGLPAGKLHAYSQGMLMFFDYRMYPPHQATTVSQHTQNIIYRYADVANSHDTHATNFLPVLYTTSSSLDGAYNEAMIVFNNGAAPHQFQKAEQIMEMASGTNPQLTIVPTGNVYRLREIASHSYATTSVSTH